MIVEIHGVKMNHVNDMVVKHFTEFSEFENEAISFWEKSLVPGETAIDVGSYSGLYAIKSALAGCVSIAYECNPIVLKRLKENVKRNNVTVEIRNVAASHCDGIASFWIKPGTILTSASSLIHTENYERMSVKTETLKSDTRVCSIKIDVEGEELSVLKGAKDILETYKPKLIIECLTLENEKDVTEYLKQFGYAKIQLDNRNFGFV